MKNIAIIPARGGSKRIPRKNAKLFLGKPIISYSIEAAIKSDLFDVVMVSTDDKEIADIAIAVGAKVPFIRSAENSNDYATLTDVLIEVISNYEADGIHFDNICCILPTAPLISVDDIKKAYKKLNNSSFNSICPVIAFSYPILRALEIDNEENLKMIWPQYLSTRSQDINTAYHDSGTFYWVKKRTLLSEQKILTENGTAIIIDEMKAQDIDNETDWKLAELKYKLIHNSE